jgi:hypothetical protein
MMKNEDLNRRQLQRLLNDLPDLSQPPTGDHLTTELIIGYVTETLTKEDVERVDAHLLGCVDCTDSLEHLFEVVEAWQGDAGAQRLETLSQKILQMIKQSTEDVVDESPKVALLPQLLQLLKKAEASWQQALQAFTQRPASPALASDTLADGDSLWDDVLTVGTITLTCKATRDSHGNLHLFFSSDTLELEGKEINLRLEYFKGKLRFEAETNTDVGAELVIPKRLVPDDLSQLELKLEPAE